MPCAQRMGLITAKPMLYVANIDDSQAFDIATGAEVGLACRLYFAEIFSIASTFCFWRGGK